jgi:hypothetical protein
MNLIYLNENAQILIKNLKPSGYDQLKNLKIKNGTEIRILIYPYNKIKKIFDKEKDKDFKVNTRIDWYFKDKRIRRYIKIDYHGKKGAKHGWREISSNNNGKVTKQFTELNPENEKEFIKELDKTCLFKVISNSKNFMINGKKAFLDHNTFVKGSRKISIITTELENDIDESSSGLLELAKEYPELQFYILGEISTSDIAKKLLNL